jgi:hypothetical protein
MSLVQLYRPPNVQGPYKSTPAQLLAIWQQHSVHRLYVLTGRHAKGVVVVHAPPSLPPSPEVLIMACAGLNNKLRLPALTETPQIRPWMLHGLFQDAS